VLIVPQLARGLESKKLSKNNMYPGLRPEHLYLFFACSNKKIFLAKVIGVNNCSRARDFFIWSADAILGY
jgi:hypothetical protein